MIKLLALFVAIVGALLLIQPGSAQVVGCQVDTRQTYANGHTVRVAVPVDLWFCIGTPTLTVTPTPTRTPSPTITSTRTPTSNIPTNTPLPTPAPAPTIEPSGNYLIVPDDYATINSAVAASEVGDIISIRTGTYYEQVEFYFDKSGITFEPYGDGPVWIDGECVRTPFAIHGSDDVTIRGLGVRQAAVYGINIERYSIGSGSRLTVQDNVIQDYNCSETQAQYAAGIAAWYAGSQHTITNNVITRRVELPGEQRAQGNGIWFKSNTENPSGGGHIITGNLITGGYDGIGGETEDDPRGSFDRNTVIARNTIRNCLDDGIQSEGGNVNIWIQDNVISECGIGIGLAPNLVGPIYIERNRITSASASWATNIDCFKVGNHGTGTAYITNNFCQTNGVVGIAGNGMAETNPGLQRFVVSGNTFITTRYIYDFPGVPLAGSSFNNACLQTSDSSRWIKWGNVRYTDHASFVAATGQETGAQVGNCMLPTLVATATPTPSATYLPTSEPTFTPLVTFTPTITPTEVVMATLLQDSFTDTNGVDLTAHTMNVGPGWSQLGSAQTIQSNRATQAGGLGDGLEASDAGVADVVITAHLVIPNTNDYAFGLAGRIQNINNNWWFRVERDGGGSPYIAILEWNAGAPTLRASTPFSINPTGLEIDVTVTLSGTSITFAASTGDSINYTSSFLQTQTKMGLINYSSGGYTAGAIDDFLVTGTPVATGNPWYAYVQQ